MTAAGGASIRVLHVDDDPEVGAVVAEHLVRVDEGFEVVTEPTARSGLDRLDEDEAFDCVVSDHDMPGMDGLEFLRIVRDRHGGLPFILYTGKGSEEIASEAISAGVTDYLQKGTGTDQYEVLAHRIERAVAGRRAREGRKESERMFATLVENLPGMAYRCGVEAGWPMDYVSEGCLDLTGYEPAAVERGEVVWEGDVIHPDDREAVRESVEEAIAEDRSFTLTYRIVTKDGDVRWVWEQGSQLGAAGEPTYLVGFISDVTERRRRRQELQAEREFTESALNALDDAFYVVDHETGEFLRWNDRLAEFTGYSDEELSEMTVFDLVPDDEVQNLLERAERILDGDETPYELETVTKDGDHVPIEVRGSPMYDADGELIGIGSIARDVTARKQREERLENFASAVSHDLRNPLHVIQARVELAQRTGDVDHLEQALEAIGHMDSLIDDLLTLALQGQTVGETEPVDLASLAREAWRTVETGAAQLEIGEPGTVEADRDRLGDVFANLFRNAVVHSDVDTRSLTLEQAVERAEAGNGDGEAEEDAPPVRVRVGNHDDGFYVADDGPGVPPDERERIFEHGYTTDDDGTGLGLSIVHGIAEAHGWTVSVADSEWGGARFEFST